MKSNEEKWREDYVEHIANKLNTTIEKAEQIILDSCSIGYFGLPFYLEARRKSQEEMRATDLFLDEAASIFQEIYDGSSDKIDRSLAKYFLAKLSKESPKRGANE